MCFITKCKFYADCLTRPDGSAECLCPTCDTKYEPVCGSDRVTYASACHMKRRACLMQKDIRIVKLSVCGM